MTFGNGYTKSSTIRSQLGNKIDQDQRISLNFMPVNSDFPLFTVYRKLQSTPQESRPREDVMSYRLPVKPGDVGDWPSYWVSIDSIPNFTPFQAAPKLKPDLTCRVLFWTLISAARQVLQPDKFRVPESSFIQEMSFIQRSHEEGDELLVVQPYYLRVTRQFGYLVDFHFHPHKGVPFSRQIQQLSLSLDKEFRRNLDYYVDRSAKVQQFILELHDVLGSLVPPGSTSPITLGGDFVALPADRLKSKVYVFARNQESKSQFSGLQDHGPLRPLETSPRLLFIFREQDRQAARTLALALRSSRQRTRFTFPGFSALFKRDLEIDGNPVILANLSRQAIDDALERVKSDRQKNPNILPIIILPSDNDSYLIQKAVFSHAEIATQVCTLRILQDEDILKWALANLALQIFCKAGGYPWKVRSTGDRSLIIGISQSHKTREINGRRQVEKYFAFSVMTDSSGLFQKIQVLGENPDPSGYVAELRQNLRVILNESAVNFSRVVVHTSFKLKHREIDAIQETVKEATADPALDKCEFAVVKVNQKSRFFGINRDVNSLVPYEATRVKLGPREYLVWFEGILPDNPTVTKAFPGPTHLQILRVSDKQGIPDDALLQDLVNLSGANWRGFNAKSAPVSVFYCHLVAALVQDFHELGLPMPAVKDIRPWFL